MQIEKLKSKIEDINQKISIRPRLQIVIYTLGIFFAFLLIFGIIPRIWHNKEAHDAIKSDLICVYTTSPKMIEKSPSLDLPGELKPFLSTAIYSRVSGTLKARYVDIGSSVSAGQVLAVVDVPELDQELEQAKAELRQSQKLLEQAKYNYDFAAKTYKRWQTSGQDGALSQQDIEKHENDFNTARANYQSVLAMVENHRANVKRLLAMEAYKTIRAPFSGVISQRNVDPGANIVAGGSATSTNLFEIEQIDKLRGFINVPQSFVNFIKPQMTANIRISERPDELFQGKVLSTSNKLDYGSRTMLTQVIISNSNKKLYPGLYVTVSLGLDKSASVMTVPDNTVLSTPDGLKVVSLDSKSCLHYIPIKVGRDYGEEFEVKSGLNGNELLVRNPIYGLKEGQKVIIVK